MPDKLQENAAESKDLKTTASRRKALIITVASTALLVCFASYTLLRTDFKTYPDVDISEITRAPDAFSFAEEPALEEVTETPQYEDLQLIAVADEQEHEEVENEDSRAEEQPQEEQEPETTQPDEEKQIAAAEQEPEHHKPELVFLKNKAATLEYQLSQRDVELQYLHDELDAARRQLEAVALTQPPLKTDVLATEADAVFQNQELMTRKVHLEGELAEARVKIRQNQETAQQAENRSKDLEKLNRELNKRQEALIKERAQLEDQLMKSQQRILVQERSFQELTNALKSHKEAMRRMDQARMELASELDATKSQYAKLLQAVASKVKDLPTQALAQSKSLDLVAEVEPAPALKSNAPSTQEGDVRYHVVAKGDTLTSISRQYYGTAQRWHEVYDANKAVLSDHNRLKVGLVLVIP
ncbi:MAG: LysM peptidoglycan-binding domain-containing protein [Chlamydiales bacterium]|nr:LysM peptidoglycan-binding domain-containing protein [Chlamydiales bacterium]